jgi:hypothetical protein
MISGSTFTATHVYCVVEDGGFYGTINIFIVASNGGGSYGTIGTCTVSAGSESGSGSLTPRAMVPGSWLSVGGFSGSGSPPPPETKMAVIITP